MYKDWKGKRRYKILGFAQAPPPEIRKKKFVVNIRCLEGIATGYFLNASQKSHRLRSLNFSPSECVCVCACARARACVGSHCKGIVSLIQRVELVNNSVLCIMLTQS